MNKPLEICLEKKLNRLTDAELAQALSVNYPNNPFKESGWNCNHDYLRGFHPGLGFQTLTTTRPGHETDAQGQIELLKQDRDMFKNEAEAMKKINDGLKLKLEMTHGEYPAQAQLAIQKLESRLEIQTLESQLAVQKLEFQLERQTLASELAAQKFACQKLDLQLQLQTETQSKADYQKEAHALLSQCQDKGRQLDKLAAADVSPLQVEVIGIKGQEIDELKVELEMKAQDVLSMELSVFELMDEMASFKLQLKYKDQQIDKLQKDREITQVLINSWNAYVGSTAKPIETPQFDILKLQTALMVAKEEMEKRDENQKWSNLQLQNP